MPKFSLTRLVWIIGSWRATFSRVSNKFVKQTNICRAMKRDGSTVYIWEFFLVELELFLFTFYIKL